jgi:hypothetical protein
VPPQESRGAGDQRNPLELHPAPSRPRSSRVVAAGSGPESRSGP